jgi:hypothetical protein
MKPKTQPERQMDPMVAAHNAGKSAQAIAEMARRKGRYKGGVAQPVAKPPLKVGSESQGARYSTKRIGRGN